MGLQVAELVALFKGDTRDIDRAQDRVRRDAQHTQSVFKTAAGTMAGFLGAGLAERAVRGIGGIITASSKLEQTYSRTMAMVAAQTDAPAAKLKALEDVITDLGAKTKFSGGEVAEAVLELIKAGLSIDEVLGGGLDQTLTLATAGSLDLAAAATIAANAQKSFRIETDQMGRVTTALAGGANASTASVESLGQALAQVGPGARNAGLSLEETVAALAAFDANGIKGSDSGTTLKTMLANLIPQTDAARSAMDRYNLSFVNTDGSFKSLVEIAGQLKGGLGDLSEAQRTQALNTIFGSDASRAATVLMNEGAKGIENYLRLTKDQTAVEKLSKAAMSGTAGAVEKLEGAVETAGLEIGESLAPAIEDTANLLADDVVPAVTGFIEGMQDGTGAGGDFADILGDIRDTGKAVFEMFDSLPGPVKKTGLELAIGAVAVSKLSGGFDLLSARSGMGLASLRQFRAELSNNETRLDAVKRAAYGFGAGIRNVAGAGGLLAVADGASRSNKALGALETTVGGAALGFGIAGPAGAAVGALGGLTLGILNAKGAADDGIVSWENYGDTLDDVSAAVTRVSRKFARESLKDVFPTTRAAGLSDNQVVSAVVAGGKAREQVQKRLLAIVKATETEYQKKFAELVALMKQVNDLNLPSETRAAAQERAMVVKGEVDALKDLVEARKSDVDAALGAIGAVQRETAERRRQIHAENDYAEVLRGLPDKVITEVGALNTLPTMEDVKRLQGQYKLTPKEVQTLLEAVGVDVGLKTIKEWIKKWGEARRLPPIKPKVDTSSISAAASLINDMLSGHFPTTPKPSGGGTSGRTGGTDGRIRPRGTAREIAGQALRGVTGSSAGLGRVGTPVEILQQRTTIRDIERELNAREHGTRLEILEQRSTIADLRRQLADPATKGIERRAITARLNEAKKELTRLESNSYKVRGLDRQLLKARLAEARKELARLVGAKVDDEAVEAFNQRKQAIMETLASSQTIFTTGTTSASQLLRNLQTGQATNAQFAAVVAGLSKAGLAKDLIEQFIANGPSAQALSLGQSILANADLISQLNAASATLASQQATIGAAGASGNYASLLNIENFNSYGMTPDEVAARLYFTATAGA